MTMFDDLLSRLRDNVRTGLPDQADQPMRVPASSYSDPEQYEREMREIFLRVPLMVALACEVREPGDYVAFDVVGRPISWWSGATTVGSARCSTSVATAARRSTDERLRQRPPSHVPLPLLELRHHGRARRRAGA